MYDMWHHDKQSLLSIDMKTKVVWVCPKDQHKHLEYFTHLKLDRFPALVWLSDIFIVTVGSRLWRVLLIMRAHLCTSWFQKITKHCFFVLLMAHSHILRVLRSLFSDLACYYKRTPTVSFLVLTNLRVLSTSIGPFDIIESTHWIQ